jgi:hypothetical protein
MASSPGETTRTGPAPLHLSDSVSYRCHHRPVNAYLRRTHPEAPLTTTRLGCFFQALIKYTPQFHIRCASLCKCTVCGGDTTAASQILCAVCLRPAHRWTVFSPDSRRCNKCGAVVCRNHAVRKKGVCVCVRRGPSRRPLGPRWLVHSLFGLGVSGLTVGVEALLPGSQLVAGAIVIIAGWVPLLGLLLRSRVRIRREDLVYEKWRVS